MRKFAVCVWAAFVGCAGLAAALDVTELREKLAAQEAALNDIEAKLSSDNGDAPEYMTSMMKNAKVAIGGLLTAGYFFHNAGWDENAGAGYQKVRGLNTGDFQLSDAEIEFGIEVSENFDASISFDLHANDDESGIGIAQAAWFRWKNICDTGFGLKIGRDDLVFGDGDASTGYLYTFANNDGDGTGWWWDYDDDDLVPHNGWDQSSVTQIAPYWELLDGKLLLEASFFAHLWNDTGAFRDGTGEESLLDDGDRAHSRNYGLGSMSFRATWNPTENLHFSGSVVNYHSNGINGWEHADNRLAKNNTALALSFTWRPACFDSLNIWSQYVHGWNVNHFAGAGSDVLNFGMSYDFTDKLTVFAQGDSLRGSYDNLHGVTEEYRGWAAYAGLMYAISDDVSFEAGWRHERIRRDDEGGGTSDRIRTDTVYATLAFEF